MLERIKQPRPRGDDRRRRQVHQAPRRLQVGLRVARPRRHRPPAARASSARSRPRRSSAKGPSACSAGVDGILVPGGFGYRGIEGKIEAIRYARERRRPVLRHLPGPAVRRRSSSPATSLGLEDANSTEFDQTTPAPGRSACWTSSTTVTDKGGTMRLGLVPVRRSTPGSLAQQAYGSRRDQRAAPPPLRVQQRSTASSSTRNGLVVTGHQPRRQAGRDRSSCRDHPWFLAVQCHPEFKSKPTRAHPLFRDFVAAALQRRGTI